MATPDTTFRLEVREQVRLPFRRLLTICVDSVSYRLLRSLVTVFIIVVAIAFLATILVEGALGRAARDAVAARTREATAYSRFLRQLGQPPTADQLLALAAAARPGEPAAANLRHWGGLAEPQLADFLAMARRTSRYLDFFATIPIGRRVLLVQQQEGLAIFDYLQGPAERAAFETALEPMKSLKLPEGTAGLASFLAAWPAFRQQLEAVRGGAIAFQAELARAVAPASLADHLRTALTPEQLPALAALLERLHYTLPEGALPTIAAGLAYEQELDWALGFLRHPGIRRGWNQAFYETFGPVRSLVSCADEPARIEWIAERLRQDGVAEGFDPARFARAAAAAASREHLLEADRVLRARHGDEGGLDSKALWLVCVSFLVCVVGIANAMLMSVLERFREIATMKCLGARNGTIAFLFITESVFMGLAGGLVGMLAGALLAVARQAWAYGAWIFQPFPWASVLTAMAVCFACSVLLTVIAAVYPARVAARMPPMEAMRVD